MKKRVFDLLSVFPLINGGGHSCGDPYLGPVLRGVDFVQLHRDNTGSDDLVLATKGEKTFTKYLDKYEFWFLNEKNANDFEANPFLYTPQFGGYCAWGLTGYDKHVTDPSGSVSMNILDFV